jgi:dihydroorotate dehydrogenase (NAD+) catalytic subunit
MDLNVRIGQLLLPNPVGVASGTFGYGEEYATLLNIDELGALYTKAVTPEYRPGNPVPRLADTPAGMLNSIGLANPGLAAFIQDKLPGLAAQRCPIIVNVAGRTEADYLQVVETLESLPGIDGYEINVSCPNVAHGGMAFGGDCALVQRLTRTLRDATEVGARYRSSRFSSGPGVAGVAGVADVAGVAGVAGVPGVAGVAGVAASAEQTSHVWHQRRPIIVKLSPNVTDISAPAQAAEAGGADAISCINTLVGMVIDVQRRTPVLAMKTGGLSGPAIRPVGVAAVYRVSRAVRIPVIGLGGIVQADDALQYLLAGAVAVQVGTAIFNRPETPIEVLAGIQRFMEQHQIDHCSDIRYLLR